MRSLLAVAAVVTTAVVVCGLRRAARLAGEVIASTGHLRANGRV